jgi:hypothetical protein
MSTSSDQVGNMQTVVGLAITDPDFKDQIVGKSPDQIKQAIDSHQQALGITSSSLSNDSLSALSSLTSSDIDTLKQIYEKVSHAGIKPRNML